MANQVKTKSNDVDALPEGIHEALQRLGEALAADRRGEPREVAQRLQEALRDVYGAIERHREDFEEERGPLAEFVELKPGLYPEVQQRKDEHLELLQRARCLDEDIERQLAFDSVDADMICRHAEVLREALVLHLFGARSLVYEAYLVDEGGESG